MSDEWIVFPRWTEYQHYSDRELTWIKNYVSLLHHDGYLNLSPHCRGVLHGLLLVYASAHGQLRANTSSLSRQLNARVTTRQLVSLADAGFIRFSASKPLALARAREGEKKEKEKESARTNARTPAHARAREARAEENEREEEHVLTSLEQAAADEARRVRDEDEPPRDPQALERVRALTDRMGWSANNDQGWDDPHEDEEIF